VKIRTAIGGGWGGDCLRNLRHQFLTCTARGAPAGPCAQSFAPDLRWSEGPFPASPYAPIGPQLRSASTLRDAAMAGEEESVLSFVLRPVRLSTHLREESRLSPIFVGRSPFAGAGGQAEYFIDPAFREQFEIAHPTARYAALLCALPSVFVGSSERVVRVVTYMCDELAAAFKVGNVFCRMPASLSIVMCVNLRSSWCGWRSERRFRSPARIGLVLSITEMRVLCMAAK
jgi:PDDEXK-like family of unknown function